MSTANYGDTVKVHYTGKLNDGTVFDTTLNRDPMEFTIGQGTLIKGFEEAIVGMSPGTSKQATVAPDEGFGQHHQELVQDVEREQLPENINPEVGQQLQVTTSNNQTLVVTVTDVSDSQITLDGNHPLAGQELMFDIQLVEIV